MKKLILLLLCLSLLFQCIPVLASASDVYTEKELNNEYRYIISVKDTVSHHGYSYTVSYRFNVKSGEIISVSFPNNNVVGNYITIPASLAGYQVKKLGDEVFADRYYLCEVILPETIEVIGKNAFKNCYNLYVVKMENPEKSQLKRIESGAFEDLKLLFEVPVYEGVEFIGDGAFSGTELIEAVTLPESLTHLGEYAFYRSAALKDVSIPESLIDIGAYAFKGTPWLDNYDADFVVEGNYVLLEYKGSATDVVLPNNIYHIPDKAFADTKITSITFNKRLKTIGDYAFEGCSYLKEAFVPDTVTAIGEGVFKSCTSLSSAALPSHLTHIPPYTFYSTKISSYDLSKIEKIGEYAFAYSLFSGDLSLSAPLTRVGDHSFCYTKINSLTVTDNVYLEDAAFSQISTLENVAIDETVTDMGGMVFYNTPWYNSADTEFLIVGDGILIQHFSNVYIDSLTLPDAVKTTASQAFYNYNGYGEIVLPHSVTHLGDYALAYANADKIALPDTVTRLGVGVFEYSSITSVVWPKDVTEIPDYTFLGSNLASFDFSHITSIGSYAFYNSRFTNVTIGKSVRKIGDYAFRGGKVTLHNLPEDMGEYPFGNSDTATWSVIPEYYVDEDVFEYNEEEDYLVLPDWVDCSVFVNITPEVTEVGYDYVVVRFKSYPPKSLGCYYGSGYQTIDSSHFEWIDEHTIKISDILEYNDYSLRFFEHYSGLVNFQYNPIKVTGMGSSDTSFSLSNIKSVGTSARHNYNSRLLTRIQSQVDSITVTFAPTTGQSFEVYGDEACTNFVGNTIALSPEPVTVWIKVISQNRQYSAVYKWILEYYYQADAPTFDVTETIFKESADITISSTLSDASVYYTTDGSQPSMENGTLYTTPVTITDTTLFKAITYSSYLKPSSVVSKTYTLATDMEITNIFPSGNSATVSLNPQKCIYNRYLTLLVSSDGKSWDMSQAVYVFEENPTVIVDGLVPDTLYYVKITLPSADITSNVVSFTTSDFDTATGFSYTKDGFITGMPQGDWCSIPEKIGTTTIVGIAPYSYRYVYGTISIPKTVASISVAGISASSTFTVDSDNPHFTTLDGSLYNKDITKLIRAGFSGKPENDEIIFTAPSTLKEIGDYAFYDIYYTSIELNEGLEKIGHNVINSYEIDIVRIPSSVKTMGNSFITGNRAAVIFMGKAPQCTESTFGENVVLYSAVENATIYNQSVRLTSNAEADFTSFFKPTVSDYGINVSWCSEVTFDENACIICKVTYRDGSNAVFIKKLSDYFYNSCSFSTKSTVESVKLFFWDISNISPYAYSEELNLT